MRKLNESQLLVGKPNHVAGAQQVFGDVEVSVCEGDELLLRLKVEKRPVARSERKPPLRWVFTMSPLGGYKIVRVADKYGAELKANTKRPDRVEIVCRARPDTMLVILLAFASSSDHHA